MKKRIAITGPESTGKTTLANALLDALPEAVIVGEFARTYLEEMYAQGEQHYTEEDVVEMAQGQAMSLRFIWDYPSTIISDTEFTVFDVWMDEKYGAVDPEVARLWAEFPFDLYLLCAPDIPWSEDPLRENPNDRDRLFLKYMELMEKRNLPYVIIQGEKRLESALEAIRSISKP